MSPASLHDKYMYVLQHAMSGRKPSHVYVIKISNVERVTTYFVDPPCRRSDTRYPANSNTPYSFQILEDNQVANPVTKRRISSFTHHIKQAFPTLPYTNSTQSKCGFNPPTCQVHLRGIRDELPPFEVNFRFSSAKHKIERRSSHLLPIQ